MNLELFIDFETRSACDLKVCGVDVYAKCPSTEVLCMAYCFGDEEVNLWVPNETLPERVAKHVREGGTVVGHNVGNFEWNIWEFVCTIKYGWPKLSIAQCFDTMAMANAMGLPGSLDMAAQGAGLTHKKDQEGRRIMLQLSQPRDTAGKIFWQKEQVPEKFQKLYDYCKQDVVVERALFRRLTPLSEKERAIWLLDHKINSRGVGIDLETVKRCAVTVANEQERLQKQLEVLTARQVPSFNSHAKFKKWVQSQGLEDVESIDKDSVMTLLNRTDIPPQVREALLIRQEAAKSSTAKLTAMLFGCTEGRARSTFEYYGAKQTGRWAGRRLQLHNMPRSKIKQKAIEDILPRFGTEEGTREIEMIYGNPMQIASDCLRAFLVPKPGNKFLCADFSNIEGRCLAWLANEEWKLKAFSDFDKGIGHDLYILEYAKAFKIDPKDVTDDQRQVGKVITLALGYQGGVGAFQNMAKNYGVKVPDQKADELKTLWRSANPRIVSYWYEVDEAARDAIKHRGSTYAVGKGPARVSFKVQGSFLCVRLPSSRVMFYPYPAIWRQVWVKFKDGKNVLAKTFIGATEEKAIAEARAYAQKNKLDLKEIGDSSEAIAYKSLDSNTKQWAMTATYGGSLVENLCQAISRDVLAEAMLGLDAKGYQIAIHVHDEIACEVRDDSAITLKDYETLMSQTPEWATGFPIVAKGWEGHRYRKA